ncbi:MAG: ABC transporter ATP-binding protein [Candidatus Bipolaricaulota bacterium]|nr:ABC transporter ATP-binding protein [Candidatus Bipolaricaulota bacterium]MDW8140923.1 ABC transporter ATP-binding protein [Candidatus Bipolaricaulota bacterium]
MQDVILQTVNLRKSFGGLRALDNVTLTVRRGEIHAVVGPNGAGKSTLLNVLSGALSPDDGAILFEEKPIAGLRPHQIARLGLVRTFQISNLFENLTVEEALRAALACGRLRSTNLDRLRELLERFGLREQARRRAKELSHGDRRLVDLALAIAQEPKLCLLDEPTAGLSPPETARIVQLLLDLKAKKQTLLIVEHDMSVVRALAESVTLLHQGQVQFAGTVAEIASSARFQSIYG